MALVVADRVRETTTTTGTGAVTLAGAATGFRTFSSVLADADTTYYTISGGSEWEVGLGTYTSAGNTLTRTTVYASSNAGSAVSFSAGTKDIFITYTATRSVYTNAQGNLTVSGNITTTGSFATIGPTSGTLDLTFNLNSTSFYHILNFRNSGTPFGSLLGYYAGSAGVGDMYYNFRQHIFRTYAGAEYGRWDNTGNWLLTNATGAMGYGTGSGGAVTQATSRTTGVTLDKSNGAITLVSAAGTTTWQSFTVTNSLVAATDTIRVNQKSGTDKYMIHVTAVAAGSFQITFATTGGTTTEQPVFNFAVIKAVTS